MKPGKLAFIDHSFHGKTKSNQFLIDLLSEYYDVDVYFDRSWEDGEKVDLEVLSEEYENFVFFQVIYKRDYMECIRGKNIIYVPMYDQVRKKDKKYWKEYRGYKVLCFCKELYDKLCRYGFFAKYVKYYPQPVQVCASDRDKPVIYFWQRADRFNWHHVKRLIRQEQISRVIVNDTVDPGNVFVRPSDSDVALYNIEFISWIKDEKEYHKLLSGIDIMFAPRLEEGIGLSFLDGMARGIVIISSDRPTANEYITSLNGYLFDVDKLEYIDVSDFRMKSVMVRRIFEEGYLNWKHSHADIISFVKCREVRTSFFRQFFVDIMRKYYDRRSRKQ